jgi:PAS domain S-box-containing protein
MKIRIPILVKLLGVMFILTIVPLGLLGYYSLEDEKNLGLTAAKDARTMGLEAANASSAALADAGELLIQQKAYDHARQMEIYITDHPEMTLADLQKDPVFAKIADQSVQKFGTARAIETKTLASLFNASDQETIPRDLAQAVQSDPGILQSPEGETGSGGYYPGKEEDGAMSERYMYIVPLSVLTADGTRLASVAETDKEHFLQPAHQIQEQILSNLITTVMNTIRSTEEISSRNTILTITAISIIIVFCICFLLAAMITRPVKRLTSIAHEVSLGDLRTEIDIHTNDEISDLADSFSRMIAALFEQTPQAIILIDADTRSIVDANANAEKMFGCSREKLIRSEPGQFYLPLMANGRPVSENIEEYIRRALGGEVVVFEREVHSDDGNSYFCSVELVRYPSSDRNLIRTSFFDITERKKHERELVQYKEHLEELVKERTGELSIARDKAEAASKAKSLFLSNMSHELRTPLNAILGYTQILSRRDLDPDVSRGITIIRRSGEHLLTLINDILDIAKIEVGKISLHPVPVNVPIFLDGLQSIISSRADEKGIGFTVEIPLPLPQGIMADETRLRQILINLLSNAVKYTDTGSVTFRIMNTIQVHPELLPEAGKKCSIRFEVEDTGIGIHPESIEHIFIPFEQVSDPNKKTEGAGLGLSISNKLARLMGSSIQVSSTPGRGSIFWLDLVFSVLDDGIIPHKAVTRMPVGYEGRRIKILVVDDISENRMLIADLLRPIGFMVYEAENGEEGITCSDRIRPDLILMDLVMPHMTGYETLKIIRGNPGLSHIPVLALSASVGKDEHQRAEEEGFDGFIQKPIIWETLATLFEQYLPIHWQYKEEEPDRQETGNLPDQAGEGEIIPPSPEMLRTLSDLAGIGDIRGIVNQIDSLESSDVMYLPFTRKIKNYIETFDLKNITRFLDRYIPEQEGEK